MAAGKSTTAGKVAAVKQKLRGPGRAKTKASGGGSALADRQQRAKALARAAAGTPDALGIARASTRHTAGRRDLCRALDRKVVGTQVGDTLRGIGGPEAPTAAQIEQRAREARELAARAYERQQSAVDDAVGELARLMSGTAQ
ncbi:hypothetical protein IWQ56_002065 [Coemansia nantahalensis]|uniref:Uncharacterized protein n=1 Tax=Coemansia helicoidea TaxID=1286919 RepID=A0ACC1KWI2_9FUNG|nr:hypothetical protein IWQ56_002065 [Coemansia nantahalensis]KAJ2796396.1 hypothetical protein H4R21_004734 [Coemansia helicoidea]